MSIFNQRRVDWNWLILDDLAPAGENLAKAVSPHLPNAIPVGGSIGQVLEKLSSADYDVGWRTGGGGTNPPVVITGTDPTQIDLSLTPAPGSFADNTPTLVVFDESQNFAFIVAGDVVDTSNNQLDDGSGNASIAGTLTAAGLNVTNAVVLSSSLQASQLTINQAASSVVLALGDPGYTATVDGNLIVPMDLANDTVTFEMDVAFTSTTYSWTVTGITGNNSYTIPIRKNDTIKITASGGSSIGLLSVNGGGGTRAGLFVPL